MKVQALANNPARAESDWHDIKLLIGSARDAGRALDWDLISDYLPVFGLESRLAALKSIDGPTH